MESFSIEKIHRILSTYIYIWHFIDLRIVNVAGLRKTTRVKLQAVQNN